MRRLMKFNCGKDQQLIKVIRGGEPWKTPVIRTMGHAVLFIFRMGQELTQISNTESRELAPQEHRSKEQSEKKEKKDFVGLHDFGSRKTKQSRRKTSLYFFVKY